MLPKSKLDSFSDPINFEFHLEKKKFLKESIMLMPQADRKKIYEHLFEDGVCIAKKDYNLKTHPEIKGVKNLYVIKALKVRIF